MEWNIRAIALKTKKKKCQTGRTTYVYEGGREKAEREGGRWIEPLICCTLPSSNECRSRGI